MLFVPEQKTVTLRGQSVVLREWTPSERKSFMALRSEDPSKAVAQTLSACIVSPVLTEHDVEQFPAAVTDVLFAAFVELNGLGAEHDAKND